MHEDSNSRLFRFGPFEADESSGELRRQGMRVRLPAQAFRILVLLLQASGELVTREALQRELWPEGTFVDFEHSLNSAMNRIREALCDSAAKPRYIETLARRGYRFIAPVECVARATRDAEEVTAPLLPPDAEAAPAVEAEVPVPAMDLPPEFASSILASPEELPQAPHRLVHTLFVLMQCMYLAFYVGALANLPEIGELFTGLPWPPRPAMALLITTAAVLIPVRLFLIAAKLFNPPGLVAKFLKLFPVLLVMDALWSLAPFLLLHHINFGLALAACAALVYSPFAQRSLLLMDARSR